jgi:hypothetical protein
MGDEEELRDEAPRFIEFTDWVGKKPRWPSRTFRNHQTTTISMTVPLIEFSDTVIDLPGAGPDTPIEE